MNTIGSIIVGIWFIPVALFIFVPLALLGGNLVITGIRHLTRKAQERREHHHAVWSEA